MKLDSGKCVPGSKKVRRGRQQMHLDERRIFSTRYTHDGTQYYAEVGKPHDRNESVLLLF